MLPGGAQLVLLQDPGSDIQGSFSGLQKNDNGEVA